MAFKKDDRLTIRNSKTTDLDYIRELSGSVFRPFGPYRDIVASWFDSGDTLTILAMEGSKAVGFAMLGRPLSLGFDFPACELLAIAVEPERQGVGIGGRLLKEAFERAKKWRAGMMVLHTAKGNAPARKMFKKHGFVERDSRERFYPEGQDAIMMSKEIGP